MEKIWLKNYPPNVAAEIDLNLFHSLVDLFEKSCRNETFRNQPAFQSLGSQLTFEEIDLESAKFASYLKNKLKLQKGDPVAIMMPNILQYPVSMFGILRAGLIVVNVNPLYTAPELAHILKDSQAKAIIILANFAHILQLALIESPVKNIIVTEVGDLFSFPKSFITNFGVKYIRRLIPKWKLNSFTTFNRALREGTRFSFDPVTIKQQDIAFVQYTGGTTGVAKGVTLSHKNVVANVLQLREWVKNSIKIGEEIVVTSLPLYHIFSLTVNCLTYLSFNALNILIINPKDISGFIKELKHINFTAFSGVNTLFNALLNHSEFSKLNFANLRLSIAGGMAVQKVIAERWQKVTGCPLVEGYGLTEASPVVSANLLNIKNFTGSIGLPLPSTEISIRDDAENELPLGKLGELCVKGPQVMQEYWHAELATKAAFTKDGWLKTGDLVSMNDDGFMFLLDRKKDMIDVSGFKVYPNEVEDIIIQLHGVKEVAVIGVPDEHSGESVKAFVVKRDESLTEDQIIEFCHRSLTRYKIPKHIEFRRELPKTNVGKILRRALR